jgi:tetratricopeptide (TPR) repeat protein
MRILTLTFLFIICTITIFAQQSAEDFIRSGLQKDSANAFKKAVDDFNRALNIDPDNVEARYYHGVMMFQMEDYGASLSDFDAAIVSDNESVELFYMRGNAKFNLGLFKDAIEDYNQALKLDSTDKEIFYNRAIAKYNTGEKLDACRDLESAKRYGDSWAEKTQEEICK